MIVSQYAAKTSMWMDEVSRRHKRFKSEWDKYVAPCITQLVKHAAATEQAGGGPSGGSSSKRPRKRKRALESAGDDAGSSLSSLIPQDITSSKSLLPLADGEVLTRGTSYEIAKLFSSSYELPDGDLLNRITSNGKSSLDPDVFMNDEWPSDFNATTSEDRSAFVSSKGIRVGYPRMPLTNIFSDFINTYTEVGSSQKRKLSFRIKQLIIV